jgi:malonyl-CoA O-methyltransferase
MNDTTFAVLQAQDVARSFGNASERYEAAAQLQAEVRAELLSRVDLLRSAPRAVLDLGCGTGRAAQQLKRRFRKADVVAADLAAPMLDVARRHSRFWRPIRCVETDARALSFADQSFDLVFTNLMLQWVEPLDAALAEIRRVLRPGGLLLASSFGPETLQELREAWFAADKGVHVNRFIDMHDFGSALQRAGFAEPVLDVDRHRRHYADAHTLMRELKAIGAHNINADRHRALTGKGRLRRMIAAYETRRAPQGLPATWQVVYAVGWVPDVTAPLMSAPEGNEVRIGLDALRASLRRK